MAKKKVDKQAPPPLFKPASLKPKVKPAAPELSSLPVDVGKVERAAKALCAHVERAQAKREESDLLGGREEKAFLVVGLIRPPKREQHKPLRLPVPHPVIDPREAPVTMFVKDPQRQYKDLLAEQKIQFVSRVVGLEKLRNKHKTFEAKRALLKEAELFLVDDRVLIEVSHALGKMWRQAKKQPVPIAITRKDIKGELERAISSAYLQINTGTSLSIKVGSTTTHSPEQLAANLLAIIPQLAVVIPNGGFDNVQSLHIKTSTSTALPVYEISEDKRFAGPSQEEIDAIASKKAEKEKAAAEREARKEQRRKERSATKDGKGRFEKGADDDAAASDDDDEAAADADATSEPAAPTATTSSKKKSKKRKARTSERDAADEDEQGIDLPLDQPIVADEDKASKKRKTKSSSGSDAVPKAEKAKKKRKSAL